LSRKFSPSKCYVRFNQQLLHTGILYEEQIIFGTKIMVAGTWILLSIQCSIGIFERQKLCFGTMLREWKCS
jgi:hypothetical protein